MKPGLLKLWVAEFIGTFALIFVGVPAIRNNAPALGGSLAAGITCGRFLIKDTK